MIRLTGLRPRVGVSSICCRPIEIERSELSVATCTASGLHFDRAGDFAHRKVDLVQVDAFLRRDRDALLIVALEARLRDMQAIRARHQAGENERAVRFGDELAHLLREIVG